MAVRVLFFGATAAVVGEREIDMGEADGLGIADIYCSLVAMYPALSRHKLLVSVNQEYSKGDEIVRDGDEVAIFTAVSGG